MHTCNAAHTGCGTDGLQRRAYSVGVVAGNARNERVRFPCLHHHSTKVIAVDHIFLRLGNAHAFSLTLLVESLTVDPSGFGCICCFGIQNGGIMEVNIERIHQVADDILIAQQDRVGNTLISHHLRRLENTYILGISEDNTLGFAPRFVDEYSHELIIAACTAGELLLIFIPVDNGLTGNTRLHGSLGNCRSHDGEQAGIHRLRNDVAAAKGEIGFTIGHSNHVGHRTLGKLCDGVNSRSFHCLVDVGCPHIQRPAKNIGEPQYIIYLIRVVRAAGSHDDVFPGCNSCLVINFRGRVGHGKNDGIFGHAANHGSVDNIAYRQPQKNVGACHSIGKPGSWRIVARGKLPAQLIEICTIRVQDAVFVKHRNVFDPGTKQYVHKGTGNRRGTGSRHDKPHLVNGLAHELECVDERSSADDGGAVLVIVHHRNIQGGAQLFFNLKTFRRFNIFEVNPSESRCYTPDSFDKFIYVFGVDFYVENVYICINFEQDPLPLHHGL